MVKLRNPLSCNTIDNEGNKFTVNSKGEVAIRTVTELCGDSAGYWDIFKDKLSCLDYDSVVEIIKDNYRYIFLIDSSTNTAVGGFKLTSMSPYTASLINTTTDIEVSIADNTIQILEDNTQLEFNGSGVLLSPDFNVKQPSTVVTTNDCVETYNVQNISVVTANTIGSFQLSNDVKRFIIRHRDIGNIQISNDPSFTSYFTIKKGMTLKETDLCLNTQTIYYRSNKIGVIEVIEWL